MNSLLALFVIAAIIVGAIAFGFLAVRKIRMTPQELVVGNRSFGPVLLFVLFAGESLTSFAFLGVPGFAYAKGAPAFYVIPYACLAMVVLFVFGPPFWRRARNFQCLTNADYFASTYQSDALGLLVGVCGVFCLVLYITVQLTGIQILLEIAGYGAVKNVAAGAIAFFLIMVFVFSTGLRGVAWVSLIKDIIVSGAILFAGVIIPLQLLGSPLHIFTKIRETYPDWLTLRSGTMPNGTVWFVSTVIINGFGSITWPHGVAGAIYSAKDEKSIRRTAIICPFYDLIVVLILLAGFSALLLTPGLKGSDTDQSFMRVIQSHYPSWVLGIIAGAGCLAALIPCSGMMLAAGSLIGRNVVGVFAPSFVEKHQTLLIRISVVLVSTFAFVSWATARGTLVSMLLVATNGATQFLPGVLLSFGNRRPTALGIGAGLVVSLLFLSWTAAVQLPVILGLNVGLVALALNFIVVGVVTLAASIRQTSKVSDREQV
jgi:solute:Na+ symporter, SSS family